MQDGVSAEDLQFYTEDRMYIRALKFNNPIEATTDQWQALAKLVQCHKALFRR
jgi:hypothetical protein